MSAAGSDPAAPPDWSHRLAVEPRRPQRLCAQGLRRPLLPDRASRSLIQSPTTFADPGVPPACPQLLTTAVGWVMSANEGIVAWTREHPGLMLLPTFGAIGAMLGVYWKRHSSPANVILLGVFTLLEAVTLGSVVSYFNSDVVLEALVITTFVFLGLTLFTLQVRPRSPSSLPPPPPPPRPLILLLVLALLADTLLLPARSLSTTSTQWARTFTVPSWSSSSRRSLASSSPGRAGSTSPWPALASSSSAATSSSTRTSSSTACTSTTGSSPA